MSEVAGEGPIPARIMIVGEAPGFEEERSGHPFVGASGRELDKMLHEAGLMRSECFTTNVCRHRPPDNKIEVWLSKVKRAGSIPQGFVKMRNLWVHPYLESGFQRLLKEIELVKPNVIIALGNVSMWALTGRWGVSKWRGSELRIDWDSDGPHVLPTYHPAYILRDWAERAATVRDLRRASTLASSRASRKPAWSFIIRPTFKQVEDTFHALIAKLDQGPLKLTHDLETRNGHIACSGIAWSKHEAICVPFMCVERPDGFWTAEQEAAILWLHYRVLHHPNARVVNQNYLYDAQYCHRWWLFTGRFWRDTMLAHHTAFCALPKAVDYQASLYCEHYEYWKDDGRDWDPKVGEDQLWEYNCVDCVRTYEVDDVTSATITQLGLEEVNKFQQDLFHCTLKTMNYGIRLDAAAKSVMKQELEEAASKREADLAAIFGHPVDYRSPAMLMRLFYEDLAQPPTINRKTKRPTINEEALEKIAKREPLLAPVVKKIIELRSIGVFVSTFINARLDLDSRLRCSFNPCGTYTFRYSSSKNAFWNGTNLQNIPKGTEAKEPEDLELPNIRKLFVPDPGFTFFDMDLDRADLQVVVWEADDKEMKQMLREGVDMHSENAKALGISRQLAKSWVHGTNYGGGPRTMAQTCGLTIHKAEQMQQRWFQIHPGIRRWQERTAEQLKQGVVSNIFGYKWYQFDRPNLPDALAWQPQSVVGRVINTAWQRIHAQAPHIQVLMQVHDSLAGQFPSHMLQSSLETLRTLATVTIPYPDPLIIPVGIKTSEVSWGDAK
jgi:DNA polymerase